MRPKNVRQLGFSLIGSTTEPRPRKPVASTSAAVLPAKSEESTQEGQEPIEEISDETPSRHFVHTVLPGGLFSSCNYLRPGDELLQVHNLDILSGIYYLYVYTGTSLGSSSIKS